MLCNSLLRADACHLPKDPVQPSLAPPDGTHRLPTFPLPPRAPAPRCDTMYTLFMKRIILGLACWSTLGGCGLVLDATPPPDAGRGEAGSSRGGRDAGLGDAAVLDAPTHDGRVDAAADALPPGDAGAEGGTTGCSAPADCDDGVACTEDRCLRGRCIHRPVHSACGEESLCDPREGCRSFVQCTMDADCASIARGPCERWTCDAVAGQCVRQTAPGGYGEVTRPDGTTVCACRLGDSLGGSPTAGCEMPPGEVCALVPDPCTWTYRTWGEPAGCFLAAAPSGTLCWQGAPDACALPGTCDGSGSCSEGPERTCSRVGHGGGPPPECAAGSPCMCTDDSECGGSVTAEGSCTPFVEGACRGWQTTWQVINACTGTTCSPTEVQASQETCNVPDGTACSTVQVRCVRDEDPCAPGRLVRIQNAGTCDGSGGCSATGRLLSTATIGTCPPLLEERALCGVKTGSWSDCRPRPGADRCDPSGQRERSLRLKRCTADQQCEPSGADLVEYEACTRDLPGSCGG